jgi:glycine/D-amino acid oxidase-like deaminating enzyme
MGTMVASDYLRDARVVVVGAGAIGSAVAYRLAQAGALVTVVERAFAGAGTTGATFAYINGTEKPPRAYHRLSIMGIRDQEDLADEVGGDWVHVTGSLHWAEAGDGSAAADIARNMRQLLEWGMRVDRLDPATVTRELEPDVRIDPDAVDAVWMVHRAGWMDPVAMAHGTLRAAVARYGATPVTGEVTGLRTAGGGIEAVTLSDGSSLPADVVVDAAGPDAAGLSALAGVTLPVDRVPGVLLVTAPAPARVRHVLWPSQVHVRPDGGSRLMVQRESLDSEVLGGDRIGLDDPRIDGAMAHAHRLIPGLAGIPVEAVRHGVRPMPRDGLPIVGFDPAVYNLYHVVTHSGITLAARLALLVTEELTGGDTAPLEAYRPARFYAADGSLATLRASAGGAD